MAEAGPIQIGDRVIHLGVRGIFRVRARRGAMLDLENERGFRMSVHEVSVRRLDGVPAEPKDA